MKFGEKYHEAEVLVIPGVSSHDGNHLKMGKVILAEKGEGFGPAYSLHQHRLREIEKIIHFRYGNTVPETDDADTYIEVVAHSYQAEMVARGDDLETRLRGWCNSFAPWANERAGEVLRPILDKVEGLTYDLSAQEVANRLRVFWAEREKLGLRRIAAFDKTADEQRELAKERKCRLDRERNARKRRAQGAKPREQYLSESAKRSEPWALEGISRSKWYRLRKSSKNNETSPSRIEVIAKCDTPVPNVASGSKFVRGTNDSPASTFPSKNDMRHELESRGGTLSKAACADVYQSIAKRRRSKLDDRGRQSDLTVHQIQKEVHCDQVPGNIPSKFGYGKRTTRKTSERKPWSSVAHHDQREKGKDRDHNR